MTQDVRPRVRLPRSARPGEVVLVKTMISHDMESGQRRDAAGNRIPRKIINRFTAEYNGKPVIDIQLEPAISANPYIEFEAKIDGPGEFVFRWYDDDGSVYEHRQAMTVG